MNLRNNFLLVLLFSAVVISCNGKPKEPTPEESLFSKHLVSYSNPILHGNRPGVKIIDFREPKSYQKGHLPGAINLYRSDFQDTTPSYKGMRLDKAMVAKRLGEAGISENDTLVVYDDRGSSDASRLWWLLHLYNLGPVYLLDGGIQYWEKMDGKISQTPLELPPASFIPKETSNQPGVIDKEGVLKRIRSDAPNVYLVDARSTEEFEGQLLKAGAKKAGRIPKSIHIDWSEAVDYGNTYTFKPLAELEKIYGGIGASKEDTIIVYCHSGVRSSHTSFVLTQLLDYKNVLNYDGSWIEWSHYDHLPFENDFIKLTKN